MSEIIENIRKHLIDNKICADKQLKNNFLDESDDVTCLWVYGGYNEAIGTAATIQIKTASKTAKTAETRINKIFNALITKQPNRISSINGKKMKVVESQPPFFEEKDTQNRFVWVFNITVTAF